MPGPTSSTSRSRLRTIFPALFALWVVIPAALGQVASNSAQRPSYANDPASLPVALSKLNRGNYGLIDVEIVASHHAMQAVPELKTQFDKNGNVEFKSKIANALVRLGEKDGPYWSFLADRADHVLEEDLPNPVGYDAAGKSIPKPSNELIEWAGKHNQSVQQALNAAMFDGPGTMMDLGSTDDPRAIPILRSALQSRDHFIVIEAARGLAEMHDTVSEAAIVRACEHAPREAASLIAQPLVYFDDPVAQRAFDTFVPKKMADDLRNSRMHGGSPYH